MPTVSASGILHPGEGVLATGSDASVFGVVLLLPAQEGATGSLAVRDNQAGAKVGAVRDHGRSRSQGGQVRLASGMFVGLVAWRRAGRRDDQAGVGDVIATLKEGFAVAPVITAIDLAVITRMPDTQRLGFVAYGRWTRQVIEASSWRQPEDALRFLDIGQDITCAVATTASGNLSSTIKPLDTSRLPGLQSLVDHAQDDATSVDATLAGLDGDLLANVPPALNMPTADPYRILTFAEWRTQDPSPAHLPDEAWEGLNITFSSDGADADLTLFLSDAHGRGGRRHDPVVIEDCAQAPGATLDGKAAGTWGDYGCLSFWVGKSIGGLEDAGAAITTTTERADALRRLTNTGRSESDRRHTHHIRGSRARLGELNAGIVALELERLPGWVKRRNSIADHDNRSFSSLPLHLPRAQAGHRHGYYKYAVGCAELPDLTTHLAAQAIEAEQVYPYLLPDQPASAGIEHRSHVTTRSLTATRRLCLPAYPELTDDEVDRVTQAVLGFYAGR